MAEEIYYINYTEMVNDLSKENLVDLLESYDDYIFTFYEYHDSGSQPVGLLEYFHNDYLEDSLTRQESAGILEE